ncbi:MAG: hypothetical protein ACI4BA_03430 [Prevotella sp.]
MKMEIGKILMASVIALVACAHSAEAQEHDDSLAYDFRSFVAKNFSRYRTMNFYYETKASHDYTLTRNGKTLEEGRKRDIHAMRFSTMVPLLRKRKVSLYASVQYASFCFRTSGSEPSTVFHEKANDYYAGGFVGSFYTHLCHKPLVLSASVTGDAGKKIWGRLYGRFSAMTVLKNSSTTTFSVGLVGMTLYNTTPVLPLIAYWHRFANPHWSIDITLPSQMYLRYQMKHQRFSVGSSMSSEGFYLKPGIEGLPSECYYTEAVMKPEVCYEYIISRHFYLSARAGLSVPVKAGIYTKNRKGIDAGGGEDGFDPIIEQDRKAQPFFSFGVSYSLFK